MGRTTALRREIRTRFFPFMIAKGFVLDMRDAPTFFAFRKETPEGVLHCDIQWEKYGKPRFILNFGRGEPAVAPTAIRGRLHSRRRPAFWTTRDWFCQDRPLLSRIFRSRFRPPAEVVDSLLSLFAEVEACWASGVAGPHIRLFPALPVTPRPVVPTTHRGVPDHSTPAAPVTKRQRLVHRRSTFVMGAIVLCFGGGIALLSAVRTSPPTPWLITMFFLCLALMGLPYVIAFFLERFAVSARGLAGTDLLGCRRRLRWRELRSVRYGGLMKQFRLETRSGQVVRLSAVLRDSPAFAQACIRHAPHGTIDAKARPVLRATARGNPPLLWG